MVAPATPSPPATAFRIRETPTHQLLECALLDLPGVVAGFTTRRRRSGPEAAWTDDWSVKDPLGVPFSAGHAEFRRHIAPPGFRIVNQRQVHSDTLAIIERDDLVDYLRVREQTWLIDENDALITAEPHVLLCAHAADCCIGLLHDPVSRVSAVFHAGWRGAVASLPAQVIERLGLQFGVSASNLRIVLGPAIQQASYQVGPEVRAALDTLGSDLPELDLAVLCPPDPASDNRFLLDLQGLIATQLLSLGVRPAHIHACPDDTCRDAARWHSYRRDGDTMGLHMGFIGYGPVDAPPQGT